MAEAAINLMLECLICQEQYSEPRVLPCQHTSTAGIDDLPKNIFVGNLIDIFRQDILQEQTMPGVCNTKNRQLCTFDTDECSQPATVYCYVCDVYMCEQCKLSHRRNKSNRKHKTMVVTQTTAIQKKHIIPNTVQN